MIVEGFDDGQDGLEKVGEKAYDFVCLGKTSYFSKNDGFLGKTNMEKSTRKKCTVPTNAQINEGYGPNPLA